MCLAQCCWCTGTAQDSFAKAKNCTRKKDKAAAGVVKVEQAANVIELDLGQWGWGGSCQPDSSLLAKWWWNKRPNFSNSSQAGPAVLASSECLLDSNNLL